MVPRAYQEKLAGYASGCVHYVKSSKKRGSLRLLELIKQTNCKICIRPNILLVYQNNLKEINVGFYFVISRVLKNRPLPSGPEIDLAKLPLAKSTSDKRESIHSINGAIGELIIIHIIICLIFCQNYITVKNYFKEGT